MTQVRRHTGFPGALLSILLLSSPLLATPVVASAQQEAPHKRLDVQAQSEIQVVPDEATLSARLWERTPAIAQRDDTSTDPEALSKARQRLEERAARLIETMEEAGLERDAISAGSLRVQPETIQGRQKEGSEGSRMTRTRLERPFEIDIGDLDNLPVMLDALTQAGVNALDGVTYDLSNRDAATDEALTQALEKARKKAELMADTLGIELGPVISVSENRSPVYQPRTMAMSADAAAESGGSNAEYRPGTITLDAMVSVSWEIRPAE
ncbi:SIMPL domain-containing protein [Halomonas sabkhae]|uniref:SIMPL domain-containing protein n=1 Tax=Halomonas sabkhae TaxID=626223 RepID=UPI0025B5E887|nr:SIMPL domain-containing protein [Halomonas sabkhae]MDN3526210.1 SIMPL domain-containing protein [Halomonas sabkhae]